VADASEIDDLHLAGLIAAVADGHAVDMADAQTRTPGSAGGMAENIGIISAVGQYFKQHEPAKASPAALAWKSWGGLSIRAVIGSGSYGTVYRAWNPNLNREVALKLLHAMKSPADGDMLRAEGRLLASVCHPNVVMVFDADLRDGCVGLSMECINGRTLKEIVKSQGRFSAREAAMLGLDLCGALAAVHRAGLLHRDVKAQNVMRAAGGRIVLMDFGAAAIAEAEPARRVCTPLYAAPEVLAGGSPTRRSDIYSLGVLLYYLATAEFPVSGRDPDELRDAHARGHRRLLRDVRPELPAAFIHAVEVATAAVPEQRPESAGALERLLQGALWPQLLAASPSVAVRKRTANAVAVLPFRDLSRKQNLKFLCDGIADEITNALTRVPGIRVIAPDSSFRFRGDGDHRAVSSALDVGTLLVGSVRVDRRLLRVVARLLDVGEARVRWSGRFDFAVKEIFTVQDAIAEATVRALDSTAFLSLSSAAVPAAASSTQNFEAYSHYLKGRSYLNQRSAAGLQRSAAAFDAATGIDPQYAEAYAGLAEAHATLGLYGIVAPQDSMPRALRAARHATQLLETLSSPVATAACITAVHDWNWKDAGRQFERAIALNPAHPTAHHWYAINYLVPLGRFAEAAAELEKAAVADPLSMPIQVSVGMHAYFGRRYDDAEAAFRRSFDLDAGSVTGRVFLGLTLVEMKRHAEALRELEMARHLSDSPEAIAAIGYAQARAGNADAARARLGELLALSEQRYLSPSLVAQIYAALGETTAALDWLEKSSDRRVPDLAWMRVRPVFDGLRAEGRFGALTGRVGL
jgi:serine/threonine-protein kinase